MKKNILLVFLVIIIMSTSVLAKDNTPNGQPFQELWDALDDVKSETDYIWNVIDYLLDSGYLTEENDPLFSAWQSTFVDQVDDADNDPENELYDDSALTSRVSTLEGAGFLTSIPLTVMFEGEDVSLLNNDAGYVTQCTCEITREEFDALTADYNALLARLEALEQVDCMINDDCDDSDPYTEDVCNNPGTISASCSNIAIACLTDDDCDDSDAYTEDTCNNPGTTSSFCSIQPIECLTDADCDDGKFCTGVEKCNMENNVCTTTGYRCLPPESSSLCDGYWSCHEHFFGQDFSYCIDFEPVIIPCQNGGECFEIIDDPYYYCECPIEWTGVNCDIPVCPNACSGHGTCNTVTETCSCDSGWTGEDCSQEEGIACLTDADCDDGDDSTVDVCNLPGTVSASCSNLPIACLTDNDCDDSDPNTEDTCNNAGTSSSSCSNQVTDLCPDDPYKIEPGVCGCGVADVDTDEDGMLDCKDQCPSDPAKTTLGECGCGVEDTDSDGDGFADCVDGCPFDSAKITPGVCGCYVADVDSNNNGVIDCLEGP